MEKEFDVLALGELLVDFTQDSVSGQGYPTFRATPGGAPANVLAMLRKLGKTCAFIGKVGQDGFGLMLTETLQALGIETRGLCTDGEIPTTLAFVHTHPDGDRDFSFYRKPGADMMLSIQNVDETLLHNCSVFHFGSLSLTDEPSREATKYAVHEAQKAGALISFDPNLRPPLWDNLEDARREIAWGLSVCDLLKIADDELVFMTCTDDYDKGTAILKEQYPNIRLLNVTAGAGGSYAYYGDSKVYAPAYDLGHVIETTGAGDTFCACVLAFVLDHGLNELSEEKLSGMLRFSNAAAYLVTTGKGAISSMPEKDRIDAILRSGENGPIDDPATVSDAL